VADRFGRRTIFTFSLLWYTAASIIMAFQKDIFDLNLWRFIRGIGVGVELVTIDTYISELVPKQWRGRAFAINQTIQFSSVPLVGLLAWRLVPIAPLGLDGGRWVVPLGAAAAIVVWWIRRRVPESPRWLAQHGRIDEAERAVSELERRIELETGARLPRFEVVADQRGRGGFKEIWRPPYLRRSVMLIVFSLFQTVGYYGFSIGSPRF
jgi:putative MFS transporter